MRLNKRLRRFIAFEWLMFVIFGVFWAVVMFLPLQVSGAVNNNAEIWNNILLMVWLYPAYLAVRLLYLLWRSLRWAYLMSNIFFSSDRERVFAEEWMRFVCLGVLWALVVAVPMSFMGMFFERGSLLRNSLLLIGPYAVYLAGRIVFLLLKLLGWVVVPFAEK